MRFILLALAFAANGAVAGSPSCAGPDAWPTSMAFTHLKNAGITTTGKLDFTKTKTTLLASERIGKDLYLQIHDVVFTEKHGGTIEVITRNNASDAECSMSGVEVYVVSKHLGGL